MGQAARSSLPFQSQECDASVARGVGRGEGGGEGGVAVGIGNACMYLCILVAAHMRQ